MDIFEEEFKIHVKHDLRPHNIWNNFIDFRKLPDDKKISKQAKELLYRPERMAKLTDSYMRIVQELKNDYLERKHERSKQKEYRSRYLQIADRIPPKPQEEYDLIAELVNSIDTKLVRSEEEIAAFNDRQLDPSINVE